MDESKIEAIADSEAELGSVDLDGGVFDEAGDELDELLVEPASAYALPPVEALDDAEVQRITALAEGLSNPDSASRDEALADKAGRDLDSLVLDLSSVAGLPRQLAALLNGVDLLASRANGFSRYVRVNQEWIAKLAATIEARVLGGELELAKADLEENLGDLLGHVSWFAAKRGIGARKVRLVAEDHKSAIEAALVDLDTAWPTA